MSLPTTPQARAADPAALPAPPLVRHRLGDGGCVDGHDPVQWFKEEVHAHEGQLKAYLRGRFPSVRDVEDVVQESFLRIWKARSLHRIAAAKAFLFRIARNLAVDHIRHDTASPFEAGRDLADLSVLDTAPNGAEALLAQDIFDLLAEAVGSLPERCRHVFILHKLKGLTQKETAAQLGLAERTVEKYTAHGLKKVEAHLRAHGIEDALG